MEKYLWCNFPFTLFFPNTLQTMLNFEVPYSVETDQIDILTYWRESLFEDEKLKV